MFEQLSASVVAAIAGRLADAGTRASAQSAVDVLLNVVRARLGQTPTGQRQLDALTRSPGDADRRQEAADYLGEILAGDPRFAGQLQQAAAAAGISIQQRHQYVGRTDVRTSGSGTTGVVYGDGDVVGRDKKTWNIRWRGGGGMVGLGALAIVVFGGGGYAAKQVYDVVRPERVALEQAVGTWRQEGQSIGGVRTDPTVLSVSADGTFRFTAGFQFTNGVPMAATKIDCSGSVVVAGDHFRLNSTSGSCASFTAKPVDGGALELTGVSKNPIALPRRK